MAGTVGCLHALMASSLRPPPKHVKLLARQTYAHISYA